MGSLMDQSSAAQEIMARSLKRGLSLVEISDRAVQAHKVDCVVADDRLATQEAMAHLMALGHRRIGLIFGVAGVAMAEMALDRLLPYQESLQAAGLPARATARLLPNTLLTIAPVLQDCPDDQEPTCDHQEPRHQGETGVEQTPAERRQHQRSAKDEEEDTRDKASP